MLPTITDTEVLRRVIAAPARHIFFSSKVIEPGSANIIAAVQLANVARVIMIPSNSPAQSASDCVL